MAYHFQTRGVCAKRIAFELEDGLVKQVRFDGGCNGNGQGIARLVEGMPAQQVIERLRGTCCGLRSTSCPDQLAIALEQALAVGTSGTFGASGTLEASGTSGKK